MNASGCLAEARMKSVAENQFTKEIVKVEGTHQYPKQRCMHATLRRALGDGWRLDRSKICFPGREIFLKRTNKSGGTPHGQKIQQKARGVVMTLRSIDV